MCWPLPVQPSRQNWSRVLEERTAKFGRKKSPLSGGDAGFSGVFDTWRDCITVCTAVGYTGPA